MLGVKANKMNRLIILGLNSNILFFISYTPSQRSDGLPFTSELVCSYIMLTPCG